MIFDEGSAKDLYRRAVWGPGRRILERSPRTVEMRVVRALGRAAAAMLPARRAHTVANLRRAFPAQTDAELDRIAREAFAAHFSNQYVGFSFEKCSTDTWRHYIEFRGLRRLEQARESGSGAVVMHPHMGPAQLPLHVLGTIGWPMHQVGGGRVTAIELSPAGQWAAETRASLESRMPVTVHDGGGYLRPALRALRAGDVVMTACDGTGGGLELGRRLVRPVCGQPMGLPIGPAWLALQAEVPLFTLVCRRCHEPGAPMWVAEVDGPLALDRDHGRDRALEHGADLSAHFLSEALSAHPGDWHFWDSFEPGKLLEPEPE